MPSNHSLWIRRHYQIEGSRRTFPLYPWFLEENKWRFSLVWRDTHLPKLSLKNLQWQSKTKRLVQTGCSPSWIVRLVSTNGLEKLEVKFLFSSWIRKESNFEREAKCTSSNHQLRTVLSNLRKLEAHFANGLHHSERNGDCQLTIIMSNHPQVCKEVR